MYSYLCKRDIHCQNLKTFAKLLSKVVYRKIIFYPTESLFIPPNCAYPKNVARIWRNIMETLDQLAKRAIGLRPIERIRLVEAILYSLDKSDPDIEKSWVAESEARYEAYRRGELESYDWDEIKKGYEG